MIALAAGSGQLFVSVEKPYCRLTEAGLWTLPAAVSFVWGAGRSPWQRVPNAVGGGSSLHRRFWALVIFSRA
jgi:hypothetical protein